MCCCGKPIINGEIGYRWQPTDAPSVRQPNPPALGEGDTLLYNEPGRCGGMDSHCHHYRVVSRAGGLYLLVRHGGGDERVHVSSQSTLLGVLASLDSTPRYWILNAIYHAYSAGNREGSDEANGRWREAAREKRIKVRKVRGSDAVKVSIEPRILQQAS